MISFKKVIYALVVVLLILTVTVTMAVEDKQVITGHVYCVLPTETGVKLEPGVCPGGEGHGAHVVKTKDGQLLLLQESSDILKDLPRLSAEQKKNVTMEGKIAGPTT
ncbi:MAG: hypothetical protein L0Y56_16250, partial [Nitrospira sp.]|nr:hypothetical protein [Nitrospira sp.]